MSMNGGIALNTKKAYHFLIANCAVNNFVYRLELLLSINSTYTRKKCYLSAIGAWGKGRKEEFAIIINWIIS